MKLLSTIFTIVHEELIRFHCLPHHQPLVLYILTLYINDIYLFINGFVRIICKAKKHKQCTLFLIQVFWLVAARGRKDIAKEPTTN
jgi:hypothetical protein